MITFAKSFKNATGQVTKDGDLRSFLRRALTSYEKLRDTSRDRYQNWSDARQAASEIKWDAVNHLDTYLQEFIAKLEARGTHVYVAGNADQARDYILSVAKENNVKSIIKSKSMTTEEIHLNDALEAQGHSVFESDLGEYIVQLRHEAPYHFVAPAMHLTRHQISDLFEKEIGSAKTDDPEALTMIARAVMREKYLEADMGISGANFAVVETGMISITENEGNARLTCAMPKIHLAIMGIEKILPRLEDLALFLPMLATMGTGQSLTCYNSLYSGPRQAGEVDGPEQFHLVLLDNSRTELLADGEQRDSLHCIRCGACLNVCPIFKNVGGHSYGTTYQGPIGSVITPHLRGLQDFKHLASASSLCGACTETCPVGIDLHHHLLQTRRNAMQEKPVWWEKILYTGFAFVMRRPGLYRLGAKIGAIFFPLHQLINGTALDPLRSWTTTRHFPAPAKESFTDYWRKKKADTETKNAGS